MNDQVAYARLLSHYPVIVVGGGQSGLSVSYYLKSRGIDHLVFEKHSVAHAWRSERWDTFCLVTPNWQCRLPGFPYAGEDPKGYMGKDDIVKYVEAFARSFDPPLREGVEVTGLSRRPGGGYDVATTCGMFSADQVVVATGAYHIPHIPRYAERVPDDITQIHSSCYANPDALPDGDVLVVGSGQSGCQIAEDLHIAGRRVHLCLGDAPRSPRIYRGKDVVEWLDQMGYYDMPIHEHPQKERVRAKANHYLTGRDGGREIDLRALALEGMRLYGRLLDVNQSTLSFSDDVKGSLDRADAVYESIRQTVDAFIERQKLDVPRDPPYRPVWEPTGSTPTLDLHRAGIRAIVWAIGYRMDFRWIDVPVFDGRGYPGHERGVTTAPGLYFLGLPWLYTWGSGRFSGIARDAAYVADCIESRMISAPPLSGAPLNELALGS